MKKILLHTCLGLTLCSTLSAQSYSEIFSKLAAAEAIELEAYLKTNPDADEKIKTIEYLLKAYEMTGNTERIISLNQELFDDIGSGTAANLYYLNRTTISLFNLKFNSGDRAGAKKIIDNARKKAEGHPSAARFQEDLSIFELALKRPKKGDIMEIKFTSLQGKKVDLATMKGNVVLVSFWSPDCVTTNERLPRMLKTYKKYHAQGFKIIGIPVDKNPDKTKVETFIKDKDIPWPQYFDSKGIKSDLAVKYGVTEEDCPMLVLIGQDGTVVDASFSRFRIEETVKRHLPK